MITAKDILLRAADAVEKPGAWTQDALARDEHDYPCENPYSDNMRKWCAIGHLHKASTNNNYLEYASAHAAVDKHLPSYLGLEEWNDAPGRTAADVADLFRRAASTL